MKNIKNRKKFISESEISIPKKTDQLFEMANIIQEDSGLPMIVYISPKNAAHGPRIKVQKDYSTRVSGDFFSLTIEADPKIKGEMGEIKISDVKLVKKWIKINITLLLDYWTGKERSTKKVLNDLKKI